MYKTLSVATLVSVASATIGTCRDNICTDCPGQLTSEGTGFPSCVVYDTSEILEGTGGGFPNNNFVHFNFGPQAEGCSSIVRSPAGVELTGCGVPRITTKGDQCLGTTLDSTFMVQFCCGTGDCTAAGAQPRHSIRGTTDPFESKAGTGFLSTVFTDGAGRLFKPLNVTDLKEDGGADRWDDFIFDFSSPEFRSSGDGPIWVDVENGAVSVRRGEKVEDAQDAQVVASSGRVSTALHTRDTCDHYAQVDEVTRLGDVAYTISSQVCDGDALERTNSQSVSRTTSFSLSVGDPFGIVSASVGFETTDTTEQEITYSLKAQEGYCGYITWTPYYECTRGAMTCLDDSVKEISAAEAAYWSANGGEAGEVCRPQMVGTPDQMIAEIAGAYSFVATNPI